MAKALTLYVCMMIFLSAPVKRNVCKSHFYAIQTSLLLDSLLELVENHKKVFLCSEIGVNVEFKSFLKLKINIEL